MEMKANDYGIKWLYPAPCGETKPTCQAWILLTIPEDLNDYGPAVKAFVANYLESLGWGSITNPANKRFMCPRCVQMNYGQARVS